MPKINDIVTEVSDLLSDNEDGCSNIRWSKSSIKHWLLEGYALATRVATHKNTKVIDINLVEGSVQTLPDGYEQFYRVISNPASLETIDDSTEKKHKDRFTDIGLGDKGDCDTESKSSIGVKSLSGKDYRASSWEAEPMAINMFYVEPPVPKNYTGTIKVLASKTIDISDSNLEIPEWAHSLAIDWALHRAYSTESESQYSMEKSRGHRQGFYELLALFRPPQMGPAKAMPIQQGGA